MDLIAKLREKISRLPSGDHSLGLKAVLQHIEIAFEHYDRGNNDRNESAFTDAIYRSNQAFEGGLKEAYRILAKKNPSKEYTYNIEQFLESHSIFRERVLSQFRWYRTEWRNKSTHDYILNFDGNESLVGIISVLVFIILLVDQINEQLSADSIIENGIDADIIGNISYTHQSLSEIITEVILRNPEKIHAEYFSDISANTSSARGLILGLIENIAQTTDGISVEKGNSYKIDNSDDNFRRHYYPDFVVSNDMERILIEVITYQFQNIIDDFRNALSTIMKAHNFDKAILILVPNEIVERFVASKIDNDDRFTLIKPE